MATSPYLFVPDEFVVWREQDQPNLAETLEELKSEYGDGPFRVESVQLEEENLKHPQVVTIWSSRAGSSVPFSGHWFNPVSN
ncbi:MAG: hypothetical protein JWL87_115 [Candidatus Adlerbacteria bacterium]|nr:hypothetical protein [Candidatus Adlerbacteria bacterium]